MSRIRFCEHAYNIRSALLNLVFSLAFPQVYPTASSAASAAVNIPLPKLYAFSMMWTLNARQEIRENIGQNIRLKTIAVSQSTDEVRPTDILSCPRWPMYLLQNASSGRSKLPQLEEMAFAVS